MSQPTTAYMVRRDDGKGWLVYADGLNNLLNDPSQRGHAFDIETGTIVYRDGEEWLSFPEPEVRS